jgi:hypothetical protein
MEAYTIDSSDTAALAKFGGPMIWRSSLNIWKKWLQR